MCVWGGGGGVADILVFTNRQVFNYWDPILIYIVGATLFYSKITTLPKLK